MAERHDAPRAVAPEHDRERQGRDEERREREEAERAARMAPPEEPAPAMVPEQQDAPEPRAFASPNEHLLTAIVLSAGHQLRVSGVELARAESYTLNAPSTVEAGTDAYLTVTPIPETPA